ncbi:receptor-like protein kinase FERONIA [Magnolia sinica]|uniref:receptor-like protein kinase FERONIA n=1 Tax=Magnolia sinica TaxID=86752 RepID=UPI00265B0667|nr:receptor-like protein kinase FERONIA [Magnolia sinica]XP_058075443.1 receptor-like protein kinase FERONIA [Magnolia sinica]
MNEVNENNLRRISMFLCFCFFLQLTSGATSKTSPPDYDPPEIILLNCGECSQAKDNDGRSWTGDVGSKFTPSQNTITFKANSQNSVPQVPYMTARIFHNQYTYIFPISPGWKFIRLYFYPANYSSFDASNAIFSVSTGHYTLLRNFSSYINAKALNFDYLTREFSVNTVDEFLNLTFTPSPNISNAYAFVNGIEIVSMPYIFSQPARLVLDEGLAPQLFRVLDDTALETVIRLNVGGRDISPVEDSGLFRAWFDDSPYIYGAGYGVTSGWDLKKTFEYTAHVPPYTAPQEVYSTTRSMGPDPNINRNYNLTWIFPVDAGFRYLVRLHFCEIKSIIYKVNQRVFKIFIRNQTAETEADVIAWGGTNTNGVPVYKDYVVMIGQDTSQELWVELHPNIGSGTQYFDSILNGIEIFKLNDPDLNLGGPNLVLPLDPPVKPKLVNKSSQSRNSVNWTPVIVGVVGVVVAIIGIIFLALDVSRWQQKDSCSSNGLSSWLPIHSASRRRDWDVLTDSNEDSDRQVLSDHETRKLMRSTVADSP